MLPDRVMGGCVSAPLTQGGRILLVSDTVLVQAESRGRGWGALEVFLRCYRHSVIHSINSLYLSPSFLS